MKQRFFRVGGDVPLAVSKQLQALYPPRFPNLHLTHLTWVDRVQPDHPYESQMQDCTLYALHNGPTSQAFLANLAGNRTNPDGRALFVCYTTADGTKPWDARHIDPDAVEMLSTPVTFGLALELHPMFQMPVQRVNAEA